MRTREVTICLVLVATAGCTSASKHLTEAQVLAAAEPAMKGKFPDGFEEDRPYNAELKGGIWWVHGTLPTNIAGGTAEASVEDSSGRILRVWHTQ